VPIEIAQSETSASRVLARDAEVVLHLPETPTTGYRWQITHSGAGELGQIEDRFVGGNAGAVPGAAGERLLRFVGRKPGEVQVKAVLRREWDPQDTSLETRVFSIVVG
jgi:inhibitor of cysteine peptidase